MTREQAVTHIAGLSAEEKRQLAVFLRMTEDPSARPRLLTYLQQQGLLESFLEAECGGKAVEV